MPKPFPFFKQKEINQKGFGSLLGTSINLLLVVRSLSLAHFVQGYFSEKTAACKMNISTFSVVLNILTLGFDREARSFTQFISREH